ncbi:MAG: hypothetical protein WC340_03115 [Kiritimatiellia bacterium]
MVEVEKARKAVEVQLAELIKLGDAIIFDSLKKGQPSSCLLGDVLIEVKKDIGESWFYYWLRSPLGEQCITSLARGAVRKRMLFSRLAEGNIDLPDYKTQQLASAALAELNPMRTSIERQLTEIDLLPQKILSEAFGSDPTATK